MILWIAKMSKAQANAFTANSHNLRQAEATEAMIQADFAFVWIKA
jgi:hypothetical protein